MSQQLISVLIPAYNAEKYLAEAIESVLAQTWRDLEIIVINDGSRDDTKGVCSRYLDRIVYLEQQNAGPAVARNRGIAAARGEFIAFLDADDSWLPEKLERQMEVFRDDPETSLVYTKFVEYDDATGADIIEFPPTIPTGDIFDMLIFNNHILLSSVLVRKSVLDALGGFDEELFTSEDTNLWIKIAKLYRPVGVDRVLTRKRTHPDNTQHNINVPIGTLISLDKIIRMFPDTAPSVYPPMKRAYRFRGKLLMDDYFHHGMYRKCKGVCRKLFGRRIVDAEILRCYLLSCFPEGVVNGLKRLRAAVR